MIFLINSKYTIWLPVYSVADDKYQDPFYKFLLFIEILLSLISLAFTLITAYIVVTSQAFHRNLNFLIAVIISCWLVSLISRTLLTPYLIALSGTSSLSNRFHCWWTDDVAEMAPLQTVAEVWPLFLGGFLSWYYICLMVSCMFFLALERTFASWFIRDYEKTARVYILSFLLIIQQGTILIMTLLCFWNLVNFAFAIGFSIFINFVAVLMFWSNRHYNMELLRKFDGIKFNPSRSLDAYSLPTRFQAKENVRAFNLTTRFLIVGFVMIFTAITLVITLTYKWFPSLETLLVYCMENCIHLNPIIVCPVGLFSVSTWSKALLSSRGHWLQRITNIDLPKIPIGVTGSQQQETDTYFHQLKTSWEHRISPKV